MRAQAAATDLGGMCCLLCDVGLGLRVVLREQVTGHHVARPCGPKATRMIHLSQRSFHAFVREQVAFGHGRKKEGWQKRDLGSMWILECLGIDFVARAVEDGVKRL